MGCSAAKGMERLRLRRLGLPLASLAVASSSATARADSDWTPWADLCLYFGARFDHGQARFEWGLELRGLMLQDDNHSGDADALLAIAARVGTVDGDAQFLIGGQAGLAYGLFMSSSIEIALGYREGEQGGMIVQPGFDQTLFLFDLRFAYDFNLREPMVAGGVLLPPIITPDTFAPIEGRPLRNDAGYAPLPHGAVARIDPVAPMTAPADAMTVWANRARAEWASVPAFLQLARHLGVVAAPRSLIARSIASAAEEVRHTVLAGGIASRIDGRPLILDRPGSLERALPGGTDALAQLAIESWVDGCLGEGTAAAVAAHESTTAVDPAIASTACTVARDEASHAALSWDIVEWTLREGGAPVARALRAARLAMPRGGAETTDERLRAFGCATDDERDHILARHREGSIERLDALLAKA